MSVYTTEIASDKITSDNPIHQRLLQAYYLAKDYIQGDVLEIGCGEGRGLALLAPNATSYTALDKIGEVIERLGKQYPNVKFIQTNIPPLKDLKDNSFDVVISFQVIEHIKKDRVYLKEIHRVLKPGGKAIITTPNIKKTLSRNPWHIREYTADQLKNLASQFFDHVEMKGVAGNEKVMEYYEMNKKSVQKITRYDILNFQYLLPRFALKIPYEILNRMNRNKLQTTDNELVKSIKNTDYVLSDDADNSLDLFCIMTK